MPMMAIMASRPFANSAASFVFFASGSDAVSTLNPKSPAAAGVPADWSWDLAGCHVSQDLTPPSGRNFGNCGQAIGHVGELQTSGRAQIAWEFDDDDDVARRRWLAWFLSELQVDRMSTARRIDPGKLPGHELGFLGGEGTPCPEKIWQIRGNAPNLLSILIRGGATPKEPG